MTIVHTSGSAGVPKAVLHTCGNHYYNALGSNVNLPLTAEDRWLLDLPLHHVAGLGIVFRCLLAGAAVAMPDRGESLDAALDRYGVTHLSVVVTQLRRLLGRPGPVPRVAGHGPGVLQDRSGSLSPAGSGGAGGDAAGPVRRMTASATEIVTPGSAACTAISPCGGSIHGRPSRA